MKWNYEKAGVSIDKGNQWVEIVKKMVSEKAVNKNVVGSLGSFSGLYRINENQYLSACCDGVGTKLEVARLAECYEGLGQDLVAMNVNDLVTCGAKPLFFLDYIACGKLNTPVMSRIMQGIVGACGECDCALLGGETAEMPDVYPEDGFDLAGFSVGIVESSSLITGENITTGDLVMGIRSSGLHSNGFTLVRKTLLGEDPLSRLMEVPEKIGIPLWKALLEPTRLYVRQVLAAIGTGRVKGMAHITGGGLEENIARIIPEGHSVNIDYNLWERPPVFELLKAGGIDESEMRRVFNLGIGFVFIVSENDAGELAGILEGFGESPVIIGKVL
ncbi:MAG TPA: phosphoribosylformylglycinamidine cyclo-ligase [Synergistales bacterium]|nr:phosphoribosylformylglycinamidine cyclo-ligase [Synergistales bacterium]